MMKTSSRISLIAGMLAAFTLVANANAALVGHWRLDETSGTLAADAAGSNVGTLSGFSFNTSSSSGNPGTTHKIGSGALLFDGSNDVIGATGYGVTNFTTSAWVRVLSPASDFKGILEFSNASSERRGIGLNAAGNPIIVYGTPFKSSTAGDIDNGIWVHVAATLGGSGTERLYINGTPVTLGSALVASPAANPSITTIGQFTVGGSLYSFHGLIDDPSIWDNALSSERVLALYNVGNELQLNYDASQAEALFDVFEDAGTSSITIGPRTWRYTTGLSLGAGNLGTDVQGNYLLQLDPSGNGLMSVLPAPEPSSLMLASLGLVSLGIRRRAQRILQARRACK